MLRDYIHVNTADQPKHGTQCYRFDASASCPCMYHYHFTHVMHMQHIPWWHYMCEWSSMLLYGVQWMCQMAHARQLRHYLCGQSDTLLIKVWQILDGPDNNHVFKTVVSVYTKQGNGMQVIDLYWKNIRTALETRGLEGDVKIVVCNVLQVHINLM